MRTADHSRAVAILVGLALAGSCGAAAAAPHDEVWKGSGTLFDRKRNAIAEYRLEMYRTTVSPTVQLREVRVYLPGGRLKKMTCRTRNTDKGWTSDCGESRGGGACFGDGLCIDYAVEEGGRAFATTIVMDGKDTMRLLRTELVHGKAVRFFRERLVRQ
jgi:hypothetical protein